MAEKTNIEWCDHTANLWWGCTDVHAGCAHCYARTFAKAKGKGDGWDGVRYATVGIWKELPKWQAAAKAAGVQRRVFCGSMMDIFEKSQPVCDWKGNSIPGVETGHLRDRYLREVIPATPDLMHLLLTKRPSNILKMVPAEWLKPGGWPRNVMTGTSPVDQPTADTLIPQLLRVPGWHFLSVEPMLGAADIGKYLRPACDNGSVPGPGGVGGVMCTACNGYGLCRGVDWVIAGGESGPKARPSHPDWFRSLRDQCAAAHVPFLFKQWGEYRPAATVTEATLNPVITTNRDVAATTPEARSFRPASGCHHMEHQVAGMLDGSGEYAHLDCAMFKAGKKAAGRLLDGKTHDGFPGAP